MPTVSVIIPTYHRPEVLALAVRSALAQTFHDFEILVMGDACTDDSEQIVRAFDDVRIRWQNLLQHVGAPFAGRNAALQQAQGHIIAYLDHDDVWLPNHLKECVDAIDKGAELAVALTYVCGPPGSKVKKLSGIFPKGRYTQDLRLPSSSLCHEKSILERMGKWADPKACRLPGEGDFMTRAWLAKVRIAATHLPTVLNFPAAWRRDCYIKHDASEQKVALERSGDAKYLEAITLEMQQLYETAGEECLFKMPDHFAVKTGELEKLDHRSRGFHAKPLAMDLKAETVFTLEDQVFPFEWHELETNPRYKSYRWSGPSCRSTIVLPIRIRQKSKIDLHVIGALDHKVLYQLYIHLNNRLVMHHIKQLNEGTFMISLDYDGTNDQEEEVTLTLQAPYTGYPANEGRVAQKRAVAYAINTVRLTPLVSSH